MQGHYESSSYPQSGFYQTTPNYNGASVRLHHGQYQELADTYSVFHDNSNGYVPRESPPCDKAMYYSSCVPNSNTSYYRMPGRHPGLPDYGKLKEDHHHNKSNILDIADDTDNIHHQYESDQSRALPELDTQNEPNAFVKLENDDFKTDEEYFKKLTLPSNVANETADVMKEELKKTKNNFNQKEEPSESEKEDITRGNADVKPAMSYIALIAKSILESQQKRLNLGSIYSWMEKNYPYYLNKGQGWRNSVRHNLSLNDCFTKAGRCEDGKGNYWAIHPANVQDFVRGDFRQRKRSRPRSRNKYCDLGTYHVTPGFIGATANSLNSALNQALSHAPPPLNHNVAFNSATTLGPIYSPFTEDDRMAYRPDETLVRQNICNPFMKWYNCMSNSHFPNHTICNTGLYRNTSQWQGYNEQRAQSVYQLNSSYTR